MRTLLALRLLLASSPSATGESERLAKRAAIEYNVGEIQQALADATEAQRLSPRPALLLTLAQCHRALHHWDQAEAHFRGYLRENPGAANRDAVEALIKEMAAKQQAEHPQPPQQLAAVPLIEASPPPVVILPAEGVGPTGVLATEEPQRSHALSFALLGGAAAGLVLAGISTGEVVSYQGYRNGVANGSQDVTYAAFQSRGNTANVFSALLFVGVGVALVGSGGAVLAW